MIINGYTAEYMQEILDGNIVSGAINGSGHLMLVRRDGTQLDAGYFGLSASIITVATDFRTLTAPGAYLFQSSAIVGACTNAPVASGYGFSAAQAGFLLVEGDGNLFVKQTWLNYNDPSSLLIQTKYVNGGNTTWYPWAPPVKSASTTRSGLIQLATAAEVTAGTDGLHAVTPALLSVGYRYLQTVIFTSSGTFTKASYPTARAIRIRAVGGGGAGGRANNAVTNNHSSGSGGGGGGYAEAFVLLSALAASETVTVGAGGTATSATGNPGGTSSFGTKASAGGGGGGGIASNQSASVVAIPLGAPGVATVGDIKASGGIGGPGFGVSTLGIGGSGGSSMLGGGGEGGYTSAGSGNSSGGAGLLYGGGGGGASGNTAAPGINGSDGAPGIVIVEVYA